MSCCLVFVPGATSRSPLLARSCNGCGNVTRYTDFFSLGTASASKANGSGNDVWRVRAGGVFASNRRFGRGTDIMLTVAEARVRTSRLLTRNWRHCALQEPQ